MTDKRVKNITFQHMESLVALVAERSFSRAAKQMLLTQPALTKNIRNLEDHLGVQVVIRSTTGVALTPEGKILYDYAQRMIRLRKEAAEKIQLLQNKGGGDIYLAASTIPATYILPRAISGFKKDHADYRISVKTEDSEEVMNMVLDREVEIGCIGKKPQNTKLVAEAIWPDELVLIVPRGHRWTKRRSVELDELMSEPFVLREKGSATRDVFESYLKENQSLNLSQFNICAELGSSEAIKEAVLAGMGVSVLSVHAVGRELASRMLFEIPLASCRIERKFHLIYLKQFELRPHHRNFLTYLKNFSALPGGKGD